MNPWILIGLAAVAYYFYNQSQATSTASIQSTVGTNPASQPPVTDTATNPTTPPGPSTSATPPSYTGPDPNTYAAVVAAALQGLGPGGGQSLQTPDVWNYYLRQAIPSFTPPTPESMFPGVSDAHAAVPFNTWWNAVTPFLPSGLSGMAEVLMEPSAMGRGWYV
jgi:hypothetical protein